MNPYIRAAQKHPHICKQLAERANRRPEWAGKPQKLDKLQGSLDKLQGKPGKPDSNHKENDTRRQGKSI